MIVQNSVEQKAPEKEQEKAQIVEQSAQSAPAQKTPDQNPVTPVSEVNLRKKTYIKNLAWTSSTIG